MSSGARQDKQAAKLLAAAAQCTSLKVMYGLLYDSMFEMYRRQKVRPKYLTFYAITSLAGMEFLNCLSIIVFLAYLDVGPVRALFHNSGASKSASVVIAMSLLAINYAYWRFRGRSRDSMAGWGTRLPWIASVYMVCSVAVVIYASTLVSAFKR
jgi:hypothetical protein